MIRISFSPAFTIMFNKNIISLKLIITDRTYIHRLSFPFTFIYIYIISYFFIKIKKDFSRRFLIRLTANRPHVLSRQGSVARTAPLIIGWLLSSPPLRFSEIYLLVPSKRTLTLWLPLMDSNHESRLQRPEFYQLD